LAGPSRSSRKQPPTPSSTKPNFFGGSEFDHAETGTHNTGANLQPVLDSITTTPPPKHDSRPWYSPRPRQRQPQRAARLSGSAARYASPVAGSPAVLERAPASDTSRYPGSPQTKLHLSKAPRLVHRLAKISAAEAPPLPKNAQERPHRLALRSNFGAGSRCGVPSLPRTGRLRRKSHQSALSDVSASGRQQAATTLRAASPPPFVISRQVRGP
jgi:hypothetical protein